LFDGAAWPDRLERDLTRMPSQKASNRPSNFVQSDLRAEKRCLKAERSKLGLSA